MWDSFLSFAPSVDGICWPLLALLLGSGLINHLVPCSLYRVAIGEAREIIKTLPDEAWVRCSAGHGTKDDRWYGWLYCPMADLEAAEYSDILTRTWITGLLVRRSPADGELRYLTTWVPPRNAG